MADGGMELFWAAPTIASGFGLNEYCHDSLSEAVKESLEFTL